MSYTNLPAPTDAEAWENIRRARAAAESMAAELAVVLLDLPPRTLQEVAHDAELEAKDAAARMETRWTPYEEEGDVGFVQDDDDDSRWDGF